jgi:hypothetical protein
VRVGGEIVEAVDVFVGGKSGPHAKPGTKILEDVPCSALPHVLERVIPYLSGKRSQGAASAPSRAERPSSSLSAGV